jgi:hypothetical protein
MGSIKAALAGPSLPEPKEKINYAAKVKKQRVNRSTLPRHCRVQGTKEAQYDDQWLLNNQQSKTPIQWTTELTKRGLPPSNEMLNNFAKEISEKESWKDVVPPMA